MDNHPPTPQPPETPQAPAAPAAGPTPEAVENAAGAPAEPATAVMEAEAPAAPPASSHGQDHGPERSAWQVIKGLIVRLYSLLVLLVVVWAGYMAVAYLYQTVFVPPPVAKQLLDWQGRVDVESLRMTDVPGMTGPAARAPIAHYHRVERWFQADPLNGCTISGCHNPLPHGEKAKVPAFTNFHSTFLSCQMCHAANGQSTPVGWVGLGDYRQQEVPALLQLLRYIEVNEETIKNNPSAAHGPIVDLLRRSVAVAGAEPALSDLLLQFETTEPGSPVWRRAAERAFQELPLHARGEYGAKLARLAEPEGFRKASTELVETAKAYLSQPPGTPQRVELHKTIHASLRKEPLTCVSCHGQQPSAINLEALGYPASRVKFLSRLQLANLMQQIREGQQFHLPQLLGSENGK